MNSGYYAAFTGLMARMEALDVVANNLANVSTTGFREQREFYQAVTAGLSQEIVSPLNRAINDFGVLGGLGIDEKQGSLQSTGNTLDLAVSGPGFFAVQTPRGIRYTRDGAFREDTTGQLVTKDGDPVLGPSGPIVLPQGQVSVASDGTISVANAVAGQLRVAEFAPATALVPEGDSDFIAPAGSEKPATTSTVDSGMLEASNVNAVQQTVNLMILQRHSEMLEHTLSIFLDDFNRTAVTDLARD